MIHRLLATAVLLALLAGCTSSTTPPAPGSSVVTRTQTLTRPPSPSGAVVAGPTSAVPAPACPFAGQAFVRDTIGMRLGRVSVLKSGGQVVGCRIYAVQDSPFTTSENLPGPNQPVVEVVITEYPTAVAAHNAFVRMAQQGRNPQQNALGRGVTGVCFQTDFYAKDKGQDWACGFSLGTRAVLVRTVVVSPALNAVLVTRRVLSAL
ncbi:MAG TPA: hypothetical protein VGN18_17955 [Jatrophihabitans sp.]|uniref:hypothetical protein n=1 Tax=Jatrophihabitans sp. TaxID=1932789 RepID=UPI002E015F3C|nr:hypothetical protein [Jatrophihabitans sp.]